MSGLHPDFSNYKKEKEFFIGIDSDGCVFDSMELKHKECFIPNIIKYFHLQSISKYARSAAEFVNLYSKWRGCNRWPGVVKVFDLLKEWPEAMERKPNIPPIPRMRRWLEEAPVHSNATLKKLMEEEPGNDELENWMAWSLAVNASIADMVHDLPPFPSVQPSLEKMQAKADCVVVSSTPSEALSREWGEHGIDAYVKLICGQEHGKKKDHLANTAGKGYDKANVLMIGDAPGDRQAAEANGMLFYPILPGHEEKAWKRLHDEALDRFFSGTYAGAYADELIDEFEASLPDHPSW
ncbi:MAG: HAD hydrolase-like protein [Planctomycetes bacterium]|nr:HAD hydrolase-like protein [Planctomycetota bacterium]